jgi:putative transposase
MKLVGQHVIARPDPLYQRIDVAAFASKNLWNAAHSLMWQSFIFRGMYVNNTAVFHLLKQHEAYQALLRKVSNHVLMHVHQAWVGFFEAREEWREHLERFTGRPKLPGCKHKTEGPELRCLAGRAASNWERWLVSSAAASTNNPSAPSCHSDSSIGLVTFFRTLRRIAHSSHGADAVDLT